MRRSPILLLLAIALSLLAQPSWAAVAIPFQRASGLILVKVAVEGRAEPLQFLLDSGAGTTVLDLQTARRLGLPLGHRETIQGANGKCDAWRVRGLSATFGGTPIPGSVLALDLSSVSRSSGRHLDGLLGLDFLRTRITQVDYATRTIRILTRAECDTLHGQALPLISRNDALCVSLAVNDAAPGLVRVDTGCDSALEWVAAPRDFAKLPLSTMAATSASQWTIPAAITLGAERVANVPVGFRQSAIFPGERGLLGNALLSRFTVTLDGPKARLLLTRSR